MQRLTNAGLRKLADICQDKEIAIIAITTLNVRDVFLLSPPLYDARKRLYYLTFACITHPSNIDFLSQVQSVLDQTVSFCFLAILAHL